MKFSIRKILLLGISIIFIWLSFCCFGSYYSTRSRHCKIPPATTFFEQNVENISIKTKDNIQIKAWWISNPEISKAVILLNGIGANRIGMTERAKIYLDLGYNVLMPDLRGTGESEGDLITFGWQERIDLEACYQLLRNKGFDKIGVHGNSLGAATIAYSLLENPRYNFIVMESVYDNIENALNNRLKVYHIPTIFSYPMIAITEARIEAKMEKLRPEDYVNKITVPTLIFAGDSEQKVKKTETEIVFSKIGTKQKKLHFFKGEKHENFLNRYSEEYEEILRSWIKGLEN